MVDVRKGKGLNLMEQVVPQILCKTRRGFCAGKARKAPARQRAHRHQRKDQTDPHDIPDLDLCARLRGFRQIVDEEGCRNVRDCALDDRFPDHEEQRDQRGSLIFPHAFRKLFDHFHNSVVRIPFICSKFAAFQNVGKFSEQFGQRSEFRLRKFRANLAFHSFHAV